MLKYKIVRIVIYENKGPGLKLDGFVEKLHRYMRRKRTNEPPLLEDGAVTYFLRNGLRAIVYPMKGNGFLEMRVEGEEARFKKAVESMRSVYSGPIVVQYLIPV